MAFVQQHENDSKSMDSVEGNEGVESAHKYFIPPGAQHLERQILCNAGAQVLHHNNYASSTALQNYSHGHPENPITFVDPWTHNFTAGVVLNGTTYYSYEAFTRAQQMYYQVHN